MKAHYKVFNGTIDRKTYYTITLVFVIIFPGINFY